MEVSHFLSGLGRRIFIYIYSVQRKVRTKERQETYLVPPPVTRDIILLYVCDLVIWSVLVPSSSVVGKQVLRSDTHMKVFHTLLVGRRRNHRTGWPDIEGKMWQCETHACTTTPAGNFPIIPLAAVAGAA